MDMKLADLMDVLSSRHKVELNVYSGESIDSPTEIHIGTFKQIDTCIKEWEMESCLVMDVIPKGDTISIGVLEN